jgi:hypothetical protein
MSRLLAAAPRSVAWGCREDRDHLSLVDERCRLFAEEFEPIPRAAWKSVSLDHLTWTILDQLDGMCTANAGTQAVMACRELAGMERRLLDPGTLYLQHSRWGTGSTLRENVDALLEVGVCSAAFTKRPQTSSLRDFPDYWQADARRHRILPGRVWNLGGQFDPVVSALQRGFLAWIGVRWPGGGGHSVLCSSYKKRGNVHVLRGPNSWGSKWNGDGFWELTEAQCSSMPGHGAFAVQAVVES